MCRANSLKKAIRQIIEHTERGKPIYELVSRQTFITGISEFTNDNQVVFSSPVSL